MADDPAPLGRSWAGHSRHNGLLWLAGDHHIHTQYSSDAQYRVIDQVRHANAYGLDWMVITDHGSVAHAKIGVDKVNPDIVAARAEVDDTLVFQGFEWNIPAAEHGTVFVHPGTQRGRRPQGVREHLRRRGHQRPPTRPRPTRRWPSPASTSSARRSPSAASRTRCSWPTTRPARASTRRTRSAAGATPTRASRSASRARPATRPPASRRPGGAGCGRGGYDNAPAAASFAGVPAGELPHLGRLRLDDRDRRRPVGQPARRGQAVVDHRELRLAQGLRGQRAKRGGGDFNANGRYDDPVYGGGPLATRQQRLLARLLQPDPRRARPTSPTRRSWRACAPAGSGSTTAA